MDREEVRKIVEEYAKLVVQTMVVNKIILYGSYARGDYRINSDIDVAVVISKNNIEPVLLIEEEDRSGFLDSISKYGEVVYSNQLN